MAKWKLQAVEPDTCDPPGCRYLEWWDVEAAPGDRVHTVAAFERVCPAHADDVPDTEMLGFDGNWKPRKQYIEYQRAWFRRLNHVEWLQNHPDEAMPAAIAGMTSDPVTTGSLPAPAQAKRDGLSRAYQRNKDHNGRKNALVGRVQELRADIDISRVSWSWEGVGDARVLTIDCDGQLTAQQQSVAQSFADTRFGVGRVIVVS
jgi:hypothetical protein